MDELEEILSLTIDITTLEYYHRVEHKPSKRKKTETQKAKRLEELLRKKRVTI